MNELQVRFLFRHNKHLYSFENIHELPDEVIQTIKKELSAWEIQVRETAVQNILLSDLKSRLNEVVIKICEEKL